MKKDIKNEVLEKIDKENIRIKPRRYFIILKVLIYAISGLLLVLTVYIFNLMFYLPRRSLRLLEQGEVTQYLSLFPWPLIIIAVGLIALLIYIYRHYEGGYKKQIGITALIILAVVLFGGTLIARTNINQELEKYPRFQRFYQWNEDNFVPRGPRQRLHQPRYNFSPNMYNRTN